MHVTCKRILLAPSQQVLENPAQNAWADLITSGDHDHNAPWGVVSRKYHAPMGARAAGFVQFHVDALARTGFAYCFEGFMPLESEHGFTIHVTEIHRVGQSRLTLQKMQ